MTVYSLGYEDSFGKMVADSTTDEGDLGGHYPFSPERWRLFLNGTRQFVQYGSITGYSDLVDSHQLTPQSQNDVFTLESTERFRYHTGYVSEWSGAMRANQSLQSGDVITMGYGNADLENSSDDDFGPSADGWFMRWHSGLSANEVEIAMLRAGAKLDSQNVTLKKGITIFSRFACYFNWYGVGNAEYIETYTDSGRQYNPVTGRLSNDDGKGPETANKPIQFSVKADTGAGSLAGEVGSVGYLILGRASKINRVKAAEFTASIGSTGTWVPVHAIRVDPNRTIVNAHLTDISVMKYSVSDDVRIMAMAYDPSKLADASGNDIVDGDFSTPAEHSATNSVIEETSAVAQFPDSTGTVGTSATNPGGYQIGYGSLYTSGTSQNAARTQADRTRKRQISDRDIVVFLARAGSTGDVTVEYTTEQAW